MVLPARAPEGLAADLVRRHARWIARHQARLLEARRILAARPALGEGRAIPLRGLPHDVFVEEVPAARRTTVAVESPFPGVDRGPSVGRRRQAAGGDPRRMVAPRGQARPRCSASPLAHSKWAFSHSRITVRDQRSRWGSASRKGTLSFSWRLVLAPPEILDYVVVHELAHLRWAGHGVRFWTWCAASRPAPSTIGAG